MLFTASLRVTWTNQISLTGGVETHKAGVGCPEVSLLHHTRGSRRAQTETSLPVHLLCHLLLFEISKSGRYVLAACL